MASKIDLVSNALILIGDTPITTLNGNSRQQTVAANLYDTTVKSEISKHRWGFARRKAELSLLVDEPIDNDWSSIYQLPADLITLIKLNPSVRYQIYGSKVYTNLMQTLHCDYIRDVPESEWPVYFSELIEYALARKFARSITTSKSIMEDNAREYLNASGMARYTDSMQHPQTPIVNRPFIEVRF